MPLWPNSQHFPEFKISSPPPAPLLINMREREVLFLGTRKCILLSSLLSVIVINKLLFASKTNKNHWPRRFLLLKSDLKEIKILLCTFSQVKVRRTSAICFDLRKIIKQRTALSLFLWHFHFLQHTNKKKYKWTCVWSVLKDSVVYSKAVNTMVS